MGNQCSGVDVDNHGTKGEGPAENTTPFVKSSSKRKLNLECDADGDEETQVIQEGVLDLNTSGETEVLQNIEWQIFNELDNQDEASMMALASFFQITTEDNPNIREAIGLMKSDLEKEEHYENYEDITIDEETEEDLRNEKQGTIRPMDKGAEPKSKNELEKASTTRRRSQLSDQLDNINLNNITLENVGRVDSQLHNLSNFNIPMKKKLNISTALDIIDCYRRGGKLSNASVHKILRDAYWFFKKQKNIRHANITPKEEDVIEDMLETFHLHEDKHESVVVVGDLHGQYPDLLYILDENGLPSSDNEAKDSKMLHTKYIFNGDFVDRGPNSLEVVLTLFALQVALPNQIYLNRGNHEDAGICCVFGFMRDVMEQYDDVTFSMFIEVFRHIPLATIIQSQVLVLHGGLFRHEGVLLEEIMEANRYEYNLQQDEQGQIKESENAGEMDAETKEYLDDIVKDMMWSDPQPIKGRKPNTRGEGIFFGGDVTLNFLRENNLKMIVRSHECMPLGCQQPYTIPSQKELLCTIFSASNYSQCGNYGAFLKFTIKKTSEAGCKKVMPLPKDVTLINGSQSNGHEAEVYENGLSEEEINSLKKSNLYYSVHCFYIGDSQQQAECLRAATKSSVIKLLLKKKASLAKVFAHVDVEQTGFVSQEEWKEILTQITKLQIQWDVLLPILVPKNAINNVTQKIKYGEFLTHFEREFSNHLNNGVDLSDSNSTGLSNTDQKAKVFDALYANKKQLKALFQFFDTNNDGSISRQEFHEGCNHLNKLLPADERIRNIDHLLDLMDFDHSDSIEINEFFEAFRLLDIKDGKLDGKIDLPTEHYKRAMKNAAAGLSNEGSKIIQGF